MYVIRKGPNSLPNRLCAVLISSFALISFAYCLANSAGSSNEALAFFNLATIGWSVGPVAGLWFYLALEQNEKSPINPVFICVSMVLPATFIFFQWFGVIPLSVVRVEWGWAVVWKITPYAYVFLAYLLTIILFCGYRIIHFIFGATTSNQRNQGLLLLITGIISVVPMILMAIAFHIFDMRDFPQIPDILLLLWVVGIVISISKFGLMTLTPAVAYEQILRTMRDSVILLNEHGKITFANNAALHMLHTNRKQLEGTYFGDIIVDKEQSDKLLSSTMMKGEAKTELAFLSKQGHIIETLVSSSIVRNSSQNIRGFVISATDITERKQAEDRLKTHEEMIDRILENMPAAVLVLKEDGSVILANRVFYEWFSLQEQAVKGRLFEEIIDDCNLLQSVKSYLSGVTLNGQIEFKYKSGDKSNIYLVDIIIMHQGHLLLVFTDVTGERERQERLYMTDRLASIGEMAAGIAHEINNPLTGIISLSKMLAEQGQGQEYKEDIDAIYQEAVRASTVISNLLTFARKHPPVRQITTIENVVDDVLRLRSYEHKVNGIYVEKVFEKGLPYVVVDYYQMQQVFLNIILNAEYAMNAVNRKKHLIIDARSAHGNVIITISDNGIGIAKENLKRIFDPFFTTKEVGKGTGLGLSISYGIITNHGGKLSAESVSGYGSSFVIQLPAYSSSDAQIEVTDVR